MPTHRIVVTRRAMKDLAALPVAARRRVARSIDRLASNPRPRGVRKLKGTEGYRLRVGDYRVLYVIEDDVLVVTVVRVRHRGSVYQDM